MSRLMLRVFRIFLTLTVARAYRQFAAGSQPKPEQALIISQIQNKMSEEQANRYNVDTCKFLPENKNKVIEGVTITPFNPLAEQMDQIQRKQKCMQNKIKVEKEIQSKVNSIINEELRKSKQKIENKIEGPGTCVNKLNRKQHSCFVNDVIESFYSTPVWRIAVHNNVAELWYKNKLVFMMIYEKIDYDVTPEKQGCFTFFPVSNLTAEENALGHVVKVVGKPSSSKKRGKNGNKECRPCSDFLKDDNYMTQEGKGNKCSNSCDPMSLFLQGDNFKRKKPSTSSSVSSRSSQ